MNKRTTPYLMPKRANGGKASVAARAKDPEAMKRWKDATAVGRKKYNDQVKKAMTMFGGQ